MLLYGWVSQTESHHPVKFSGHLVCGSGDSPKRTLGSHLITPFTLTTLNLIWRPSFHNATRLAESTSYQIHKENLLKKNHVKFWSKLRSSSRNYLKSSLKFFQTYMKEIYLIFLIKLWEQLHWSLKTFLIGKKFVIFIQNILG